MSKIKGLVGTYAPSKGIYSFIFDTVKEKFIESNVYYETRCEIYII